MQNQYSRAARVPLFATLIAVVALSQTQSIKLTRAGRLETATGANLIGHGILSDPSVLFEGGKYRMWFTTVTNAYTELQVMGIAYAESTDGIVWTPKLDSDGNPTLLVKPTPGGWDAAGVETASVVRTPRGTYLMYYSGDRPPTGSHTWAIGLATSNDGITWTKFGSAPIFEGKGGWEGPFTDGGNLVGGVQEPSVIYDASAGLYKMWFSALGIRDGKSAFRMGYATSPNGFDWQMQPTPVMEPGVAGAWDDLVVSHVNVVRDAKGRYHAFYFGTSAATYANAESQGAAMIPGAIGYASSPDGVAWTKAATPALSVVSNTWEQWTIGGPCAIIQNGQFKVFYFGSAALSTYSANMGIATAPVPL